jgi:hydroxypyruvate isomerase
MRFSANISMLFKERPLLERFAAARAAGFGAVEIQFPYDTPLDDLVRARREAGIAVDLINLPAGDFATGVRGIAALPDPRRAAEFRDAVAKGCDYLVALGARKTNVLAGLLPADASRADCMRRFAENLRFAADALNPHGICVLVEAINPFDVPGFMVNRTDEALAVVDAAAAGSARDIAVQADLYHMARQNEDAGPALKRLGARLGHIQFADVPGRGEPGSGKLDWRAQFAAVEDAGYASFISAEYNPTRRTEDTLAWMRPA